MGTPWEGTLGSWASGDLGFGDFGLQETVGIGDPQETCEPKLEPAKWDRLTENWCEPKLIGMIQIKSDQV